VGNRRKEGHGKRRGRVHWLDLIGYGALLGFIVTVGYLVAPTIQFDLQIQTSTSGSQVTRAAIIDQLSSVQSGSDLIAWTVNILQQRGISVDAFLPGDVTVAFYATLASKGYGLIILRVHTGLGNPSSPLGLFTNEPYDPNRYVLEQANGLVGAAQTEPGTPVLFAVTSKFIRERMGGNLNGAIIILGGCYGLQGGDLAQAFISKGAGVIVGWTGLVDLSHTDIALKQLLQDFIVNGKNLRDSVQDTMGIVGPDPTYNSILSYYPSDQGSTKLLIAPAWIVKEKEERMTVRV
jgi:hypothetical protein